jgi:hypothetical protein
MSIQIEINGSWQNVTKQQVFEMATRGDIQPETIIDVDGQKISASQFPCIVFADDEPLNIVPPESDAGVTFPMIYENPKAKIKLEIYDHKIVIEQSGVTKATVQGISRKTIHYSKISAVYHGIIYLRFAISGVDESQDHMSVNGENTIWSTNYETIWDVNYEVMSCVKRFIEAKIANEDSRNEAIALQHVIEKKKGDGLF